MRVMLLLFDEVEVLDACGPFEVFATARDAAGGELCRVHTVAARPGPVRAVGGLVIQPEFGLSECPPAEILLVPGGVGTRRAADNPELLAWLREQSTGARLTLSICTGALLLARAGLLDGLEATTHHTAFDTLAAMAPTCTVRRGVRFVDQDRIVTAAGIAAGLDASLHVIGRLFGVEAARRTALRMEYTWP